MACVLHLLSWDPSQMSASARTRIGDVAWAIAGGALGTFVAVNARSKVDLSNFWMVALSAATLLVVFGLYLRAGIRSSQAEGEESGSNQSFWGLIGIGILGTLVLRNVDVIVDRDAFVWLVALAVIGMVAASLAATAVKSWRAR